MVLWLIFAAMTAAGVCAVLWPLFGAARARNTRGADKVADVYKDQLAELDREVATGLIDSDEADAAKVEISRRLIAAATPDQAPSDKKTDNPSRAFRPWAAAAAVIGIPAMGLAFYLTSGSPGLSGKPRQAADASAIQAKTFARQLKIVEARLRERPDDVRGWRVIAPVYRQLQRYQDAANAWEQVIRLDGRKPETLAEYGEVLVLMGGGIVSEKAHGIFEEARKANPGLIKPRRFLALAAAQEGDYETALKRLQALLKDAPADAPWRPAIERAVQGIRTLMASNAGKDKSAPPRLDQATIDAARKASPDERRQMINAMVERLAARLEQDGGDLNGWLRLTRSYIVLKRKAKARQALARAKQVFANDPAALRKLEAMAELVEQLPNPQP